MSKKNNQNNNQNNSQNNSKGWSVPDPHNQNFNDAATWIRRHLGHK